MVGLGILTGALLAAGQESAPSLPPIVPNEPVVIPAPATTPASVAPAPVSTPAPVTVPATAPIPAPAPAPVLAPTAVPVPVPTAVQAPANTDSGLHLSWANPDHASGIYYPNEQGTIAVVIDNPTDHPLALGGEFKFLSQPARAQERGKVVGITPIAAATIKAGRRAKIELAVKFSTPGSYEVVWGDRPVAAPAGLSLECIYAPRGVDGAVADSPWIAVLPEQALASAEIFGDYIKRTGIRRFLWDCTWKPGQHEVLAAAGRAITEPELAGMLRALHATGGQLVLRLRVRVDPAAAGTVELNTYTAALLAKCNGVCKAVTVDLEPALVAAHPDLARELYMAIYAAAKKQDSTLAMLGFSRVSETQALLSGKLGGAHLDDYVDALAADAGSSTALRALDSVALAAAPKRALWILPSATADGASIPPAAALAAGVKVVAVPNGDRGITLHLLGGAVLYQQLHGSNPPYVVVFQGNGFAVGVIAGMGAGTPNDRAWPGLLAQAAGVPADTTAAAGDDDAVLEVADPDTSFRVVNWAGDAINCRRGDMLRLPLDGRICYLLEAGGAEDLVAGLRTADLRHFVPVEITALRLLPPDVDHNKPMLALRVRNATDHEVKGNIRAAGATEGLDFIAISPGKYLEVALPMEKAVGGRVALDVTVGRQTVRVAVVIPD